MMSGSSHDAFSSAPSSLPGFVQQHNANPNPKPNNNPNPSTKKKRNLPGNPGKAYPIVFFYFNIRCSC